jgi:hypothetical protein
LRVFITSLTYPGDLKRAAGAVDGLAGGDQLCQQHADAAELGGVWRAWLSTTDGNPDSNDAIERIMGAGPWVAMDGTTLFPNRASLTTGPRSGIRLDEHGLSVFGSTPYYWTGTGVGGHVGANHCAGFISDSGARFGEHGSAGETSSDWTDSGHTNCSDERRLLCFEQ